MTRCKFCKKEIAFDGRVYVRVHDGLPSGSPYCHPQYQTGDRSSPFHEPEAE